MRKDKPSIIENLIKVIRVLVFFMSFAVYSFASDTMPKDAQQQPPTTRHFYLGMTPWPFDFTPQAVFETYRILNENNDLIAHYFDEGVPWPEALEGRTFHSKVEEDLSFRKQLTKNKKVFVAVNPIVTMRDGLAKYWGSDHNLERPGKWKNKDFDDKEIIAAYLNYCRSMIKRFNPDYFAYAIEVNILAEKNKAGFKKFLKLIEAVYPELKKEYPDLPVFLTLSVDSYSRNKAEQDKAIKALLPFTDYIAVSTYPYITFGPFDKIPADWFSQMAQLAPSKPFAVTETGFIADDLIMKSYKINIKGTESGQLQYVDFLLNEANKLNAEFVVWFVSRDYDKGWKIFVRLKINEFFKLWKDTGLIDGKGHERKSLMLWRQWLNVPKQ